jgi:hypothetical protein
MIRAFVGNRSIDLYLRNRSKYYPRHHGLRKLVKEILGYRLIIHIETYGIRIDRVEDVVSWISTSFAFSDELVMLKEHIQVGRLKSDFLLRSFR